MLPGALPGYKCFYAGRTFDVYATSLYQAKVAAIKYFKPGKRKECLISVVLCEFQGKTVTQDPAGY